MTRSAVAAAVSAAALAACSRDLALQEQVPPRVDAVAIVGLESRGVVSGLPVLGGELVALRGAGFPAAKEQLLVTVSGTVAEVLESTEARAVVRFPALGGPGTVDLTVYSGNGFRNVPGAFRYDGPGQPQGLSTTDLQTAIALDGVVPVEPGGATGFADLAVTFGGGDSALLVYPAAGVAAATIPLGLVPFSAAARVKPDGANFLVEVLALDEKGRVGLGQVTLSPSGALLDRLEQRALTSTVVPKDCRGPRILFTKTGTPVGAWVRKANGAPVIATIDLGASGTEYKPLGGITRDTGSEVSGWAAWKGDLVVFAAGNELYLYDASTQAAPAVLQVAAQNVTQRLLAGCAFSGVDAIRTVAVASSLGSDALAVSYRAGGLERVALVDLLTGTVRRGIAGVTATAVALAPMLPYVAPSWRLLAASGGDLVRFAPAIGAPACGEDLVPDASFQLSASPFAALPTFAGMATFSSGTRVLTTTQDGDLLTVLPPTLQSPGAIFRFASYGRVSMSVAPVDVLGISARIPVAVAEHTWLGGGLGAIDTGSAALVLALDAGQRPLALGGSAFGRGAVWVRNPTSGDVWDGALAYTGDLPLDATAVAAPKLAGGSSAITAFKMDTCEATAELQVRSSVPLAGNPDLVTQGPARAGALGPDGLARYGPASAPTYLVTGQALEIVAGVDDAGSCLSPVGALSTAGCSGASVDLGVTPLDLVLSSGDATAAARSLDTPCRPCTAPFTCTGAGGACADGDILCQRAFCDPRPRLDLTRLAGGAHAQVALPAPPVGVAPDRAGGFLVTVSCTSTTTCFDAAPFDTLCAGRADLGWSGALLFVPEDGGAPACLAVGPGLGGAVAVTPNGAEAWVSGPSGAGGTKLRLTRLALPRDLASGALDLSGRATLVSGELLGDASAAPGGFAASGVTFAPDGSAALLTVPADFRILLIE